MFSNNLKRSVATLGVVAGLLVAAAPASAMLQSSSLATTVANTAIGTTETLDMNAIPITADAGSGNDNLRGEAIDIIP